MADERIDIEILDKVAPSIAAKITGIADSAEKAHKGVMRLKSLLKDIDSSSTLKLSDASSKLTNALAREANAQARLSNATNKQAMADIKAALAKQKLAAEIEKTKTAASKAELAALKLAQAQEKVKNASNGAGNSLLMFVRNAAAMAGFTLSAGALMEAADAYTTIRNRLANVVETEKQHNEVTKEMFDLAKRTRAPVEQTAQAFARFDAALSDMGKSQKDAIRLTETINKLFVVGGTTTAEQAGALIQLSQAFNSGVLQGEEFRSVSENMPKAVRKAIAETLGITEGALKKAASDGKITADVLYRAFDKLNVFADSKFAKTVPTIGQAMQNLRTAAIQLFGEFDRFTGISASLSKLLVFLADNFNIVAFAVTTLSSILMVTFGPALVSMIGTAARAVWMFTAALASNPIGLLIVGISAAISALVFFGDKIKLTEDGLVSLKDVALTVWDYVKTGFGYVADFIGSTWNSVVSYFEGEAQKISSTFNENMTVMSAGASLTANQIIGFLVGAYNAIVSGWSLLPGALQAIFTQALNNVIDVTERMVNAVLDGINTITGLANQGASFLGFGKVFDSDLKVSLGGYKKEVGNAAQDLSTTVSGAFNKAFDTDFVGKAVNAITGKAKATAEARRKLEAEQSGNLRGAGKPSATYGAGGSGGKGKKSSAETLEERRATILTKLNSELDKELSNLYMLKEQRDIQNKLDQVEIDLAAKKMSLSSEEKSALEEKMKAVEQAKGIQKEFDRIHEAAIGPARDYNATLTAAQKLLDMGAISQQHYNQTVTQAKDAYEAAKDPLYEINKELGEQMSLLNSYGVQAQIEQQMLQYTNQLREKGVILTQAETQALYAKIAALQQSAFVQSEVGAIVEPMLQDNMYLENVKAMYAEIDRLRQQDKLSAFQAGKAKSMVQQKQLDIEFAAATEFFGNLSALQNSESKEMAAVGKAAAIAETIINTYKSATAAYASLAEIPYVGPALGAAAAAAAIVAGMANVAAIRSTSTSGFYDGGYTGNGGRRQVAGAVHGQEFVVNANATAKYRNVLEAMNRGEQVRSLNLNGGSTRAGYSGVSVNIENYGTSKEFEVQQISPDEIRIIAKDEAEKTVRKETPDIVSSQIANPNSRVSKSLANHTKTERRR